MQFNGHAFRWWNFHMPVAAFPLYLTKFNNTRFKYHVPGFPKYGPLTEHIEELGGSLAHNNFHNEHQLLNFIHRVMVDWGGNQGRRIIGEFLDQNPIQVIAQIFEDAHDRLSVIHPNIDARIYVVNDALGKLVGLNKLGVSFASKLLKFLAPNHVVVLDSLIERGLGYSTSYFSYTQNGHDINVYSGYGNFLKDCHLILIELQRQGIPCPGRPAGWRVSDVEMAIFGAL
jgi:hypothetical protein